MTDINKHKLQVIEMQKQPLEEMTIPESFPPAAKLEPERKTDRKCTPCCVAFGVTVQAVMCPIILTGKTCAYLWYDNRLSRYDSRDIIRQVKWLSIPSVLAAASLHFFLSESMWSKRRSGYGASWFKAIAINSAVWSAAIGLGTVTWRYGLTKTKWSRLFYKYPVPSEKVEYRMIENPGSFWSGMGWTYWLHGLAYGQSIWVIFAGLVVAGDRHHFMMSPTGPYGKSCVPVWRRQQLARSARKEYGVRDDS